mmetsp:Transcript_2879/g.10964  ORF Transcript_2879/g.10964 Transcript_2879/m.10964 type:complete len:94 (-) Transcript_2879:6072-6353(-)
MFPLCKLDNQKLMWIPIQKWRDCWDKLCSRYCLNSQSMFPVDKERILAHPMNSHLSTLLGDMVDMTDMKLFCLNPFQKDMVHKKHLIELHQSC